MLRLRLAGVPIEIHTSHLVFIPLLSLVLPRIGWAAHAPRPLGIALTAAIISSTLMLHELGHALAARAFGYRPVVQLIGLTGRTLPNPNETMPWYRDVALHLAGPAMGITLGFICLSVWLPLRRHEGIVEYGLLMAASSHLIWGGVNLLPLHPLDGGRIATAIAMRVFGRSGFLYAQVLGLFAGVVVAAVALAKGELLGFFALLYLVQTAVLIAAFRRGELPLDARHPLEQAAAQAESLYREDKIDEAKRVAGPLLEADLQPQLRGRVHLLLGWIALKDGQGRAALDHFSQCPGASVPPEGLAAAFSLIGDDERAVPLWEKAARVTSDPTLLHEWAGALIRSGREAEARRIEGIVMPAAYQAAQRVYFARGDWEGAARIAEARFAAQASAANAYDAACCWAKANRAEDALRMLAAAAQHGFTDLQQALHDDELSSLRAHAGFVAFLEGLRAGPRN
jgi:Zn-dependent protease